MLATIEIKQNSAVSPQIIVDGKPVKNCYSADLKLRVNKLPKLTLKIHAPARAMYLDDVAIKRNMPRHPIPALPETEPHTLSQAFCLKDVRVKRRIKRHPAPAVTVTGFRLKRFISSKYSALGG